MVHEVNPISRPGRFISELLRRFIGGRRRRSITAVRWWAAGWEATGWRTARTAGAAEPWWTAAGASFLHFLELLILLGAQDLRQLGVDLFLKIGDLLSLGGRQVQTLLHEARQDLAHPGRTTATGSARTESTGTSGRTKYTRATTLIRWLIGRQGHELLLRDDAVLVGIGAVEETTHPRVGDLAPGELAILVLVEFHHATDKISAG